MEKCEWGRSKKLRVYSLKEWSLLGPGSYFASLSGGRIFFAGVPAYISKNSFGQCLLSSIWPVCACSVTVPECTAIPSECLLLVDDGQLQCDCRGLIPVDTAVIKQFHLSDFWIWLNKSFFSFFFSWEGWERVKNFVSLFLSFLVWKRPMELTTDV